VVHLLLALALALPLTGERRAWAAQELWAHTVTAVGHMVQGQLVAAVDSLARARRVKAVPELDALVGLVALSGGEPKLAVRELESAIKKGSTEPAVFYWAGRAQLAAGSTGAALGRLHQALAIADEPSLHMAHALALAAAGRDTEAATALVAAAMGQPNLLDPSLYPTAEQGAVELLGRILHRFPARLQLSRTQGHLSWQARCVVAACRRFKAVLDKRPGDPDGLQMMARCEAAMGRTARALELAKQALDKAPGLPQALAARGEILLDLGQAAKAVKDLRRAADALPRDARLLTRLAQACTDAEQPRCARTFFTYAVRRQPNMPAASFGLALHLQQERKDKEAEAAFRRALALAPGNPRYWRAAASFAHLQGKRAESRQWLAQARRAERYRRQLERARKRAAQVTNVLVGLEQALAASPACQKRQCRQLMWKLPVSARLFLELHLAARQKHTKRAEKVAQGLLPALSLRSLLLQNPLDYKVKGRTIDGRDYELRTTFPFVPPWRVKQ